MIEAGLYLISVIIKEKAKCKYLSYPLMAESIGKGQITPPHILLHFFPVLCTGFATPKELSDRINRYINSSAADVIFATTRGKVKPGMHLTLGLAVKNMTGCKKLIEVLNSFWSFC